MEGEGGELRRGAGGRARVRHGVATGKRSTDVLPCLALPCLVPAANTPALAHFILSLCVFVCDMCSPSE
eukprot:COSAG06_NODE_28550_length_572_cov_0.989429_2_plen_68_part_01